MTEKAKEFLAAMAKDEELAGQMVDAQSVEQALEIAKEKGYALTAEDFTPPGEAEEINDDELQAVAGGWKSCGCVVGGYGKHDPSDKSGSCSCFVGGWGSFINGDIRCFCPAAGGGAGKRI